MRQFKLAAFTLMTELDMPTDERLTEHVDKRVVAWAKERAAELVGMRIDDDGNVVENPNPAWSIAETTRDRLRSTVRDALQDGWSSAKLSDAIEASTAFDEPRATMIARTELAFAHVAGHMEVGRQTGAVGKSWLLGSEHDDEDSSPDECDDAAEAGPVGIDDEFVDGFAEPPAHPACVCDLRLIYPDDPEAKDL